jgi:hypothetical protein
MNEIKQNILLCKKMLSDMKSMIDSGMLIII